MCLPRTREDRAKENRHEQEEDMLSAMMPVHNKKIPFSLMAVEKGSRDNETVC